MTDPIDAARRALLPFTSGVAVAAKFPDQSVPSARDAVSTVVDAYLRASVACQQCNGTGRIITTRRGVKDNNECVGPHTQIKNTTLQPDNHGCRDMLDETDEILYADPDRVWTGLKLRGVPIGDVMVLPLPAEWTASHV